MYSKAMPEIMYAGAAALGGVDRRAVTELAEDGTKAPSRIRTALRIPIPDQGDGGVNRQVMAATRLEILLDFPGAIGCQDEIAGFMKLGRTNQQGLCVGIIVSDDQSEQLPATQSRGIQQDNRQAKHRSAERGAWGGFEACCRVEQAGELRLGEQVRVERLMGRGKYVVVRDKAWGSVRWR